MADENTGSIAREITLHRDAPAKPLPGAACNGCGVCCAAEPCPLSRFLLKHRQGGCPALLWQNACEQGTSGQIMSNQMPRYVCGLVVEPTRFLRWLPRFAVPLMRRFARRWIAADSVCDCDITFVESTFPHD